MECGKVEREKKKLVQNVTPTNSKRYTRPEFLDATTNEVLLSMVVDAKCSMLLDLGKWEALWEDGADDNGEQTTSPGDITDKSRSTEFQ